MARIAVEILNDLTVGMTYESLGLVAMIIMIIMCCCGKCGLSRQNGKVNVTVGNSKESNKSKNSPEYQTKPKYKSIGANEDEDESIYKLSVSQKGVLKSYAKEKSLLMIQYRNNLI